MKSIPFVRSGKLHNPGGEVILSLPGPAEHTGWIAWLNNPLNTSFRYESESGAVFTVRKERQTGRSGNVFYYWKAEKHVLGKVNRAYIGKSANVSIRVLEAAARKLVQLEIGARDKRRKEAS